MKNEMNLILTVGTGTAGKYSDLASGLSATIRKMAPARYWLVPSESEVSIAIADLIREANPEGFMPWSNSSPYRRITHPDNLFECREAIREVICAAREKMRPQDALVVNPTSGTKQMSAGATLAALDEEVGDLVFTVGDRQDGVVKTGTEKLAAFSTASFFQDRDLRIANQLFQSGAFAAAAHVLKPYASDTAAKKIQSIARCMHAWQRLDYRDAASSAATWSQSVREHLERLAQLVQADQLDPDVLADLIIGADALRQWSEPDEAATRYYKAIEYAAKLRLSAYVTSFPFQHQELIALSAVRLETKDALRKNRDGTCTPGLQLTLDVLKDMGDELPGRVESAKLWQSLMKRNQGIHDIRPISDNEAALFCDRTRKALLPVFPDLDLAAAKRLRPAKLEVEA